jgi:hypothetical protein
MLKVLIVSDNHKDEYRLEELINIYENEIDLWLHCGDSEFGLDHPLWNTYKTVRGNMDWESQFPAIRIEQVKDTTFGMLHGHKHQVKFTLDGMADVAAENNASIIFYGHTHVAEVNEQAGVYFINPGSISQPRGQLRVGSYAIYEENSDGSFIRFYDWDHNELRDLSQKLS